MPVTAVACQEVVAPAALAASSAKATSVVVVGLAEAALVDVAAWMAGHPTRRGCRNRHSQSPESTRHTHFRGRHHRTNYPWETCRYLCTDPATVTAMAVVAEGLEGRVGREVGPRLWVRPSLPLARCLGSWAGQYAMTSDSKRW